MGLVLSTPLSPGLLDPSNPVWVGTGEPRGIGRSLGPQPEAGDLWEAVTVPPVSEGLGGGVGRPGGRTTGQRSLGRGCRLRSGDGMSQRAGAWLLGEGGGRFRVLTDFIPPRVMRLSLSVAISILQMETGPESQDTTQATQQAGAPLALDLALNL